MTTHEAITAAVKRERAYQDGKWGTISEHGHSVGEWLLIMESELREAKEAWCSGRGDAGALEELLQVVSVGFACMEQHGVVERRVQMDAGAGGADSAGARAMRFSEAFVRAQSEGEPARRGKD